MPNRLINETSPYLLQHAHNPVNWYPWGDEALERARNEDKPILLSIGYSSCHWCHVMERESFENEDTARLMNENFVCVKVDREEHPDIDHVFMQSVQAMTGRGGWPLTVFLTAGGEPFYGGTYFPPEDAHGLPGFSRVLETVADAYRNRRPLVMDAAERLTSSIKQMSIIEASVGPVSPDILDQAYQALVPQFDNQNGGFGLAPKFPQSMILNFLLRSYNRTNEPQALNMVELTLDRMAAGGIYDQIGGGFHRYSTDAHWLVPHFEKMLYDNALLSLLYLHAYQITRNPKYRRITKETLDYVLREMTDPKGGFYSAQDADTEGEEGKYYIWTEQEIIDVLGQEQGALIGRYFGTSEQGNFEGGNVLHIPTVIDTFAVQSGIKAEDLLAIVERSKSKLLKAREQR
ncbi:MAG: thioredoxin domain-containing protein, partial [Dehalococcoidia bacterium]